jgi:hypothetical protein
MLAAEEWFLTGPANLPHIFRSMNRCNDGKDRDRLTIHQVGNLHGESP